jgi:predicted permease
MEPVLNVGLPVFSIILLGYGSGRFRLLGQGSTAALNAFVYYVALPAVLFLAMARVPVREAFNWPFLAAYTGGVLGTFALSMIVGLVAFPGRPAEMTLQGKTAVFANTGYMGVPLFIAAFGDGGLLPALTLMVYNGALIFGIAVVLIELDLKSGESLFRILAGVGLALLRNPLVTATVAGIAWSISGLPLPKPATNLFDILGAAAGPCALFAMGLSLVGQPIVGDLVEASWLVFLKLIVMPAITWWLAFPVMQLDPFWGASAVILSALPTGALTFVLAQRYGIYVRRATTATLISTILSVLTVSALLAHFNIG